MKPSGTDVKLVTLLVFDKRPVKKVVEAETVEAAVEATENVIRVISVTSKPKK